MSEEDEPIAKLEALEPARLDWIKQLEEEGFEAVDSRFDRKWSSGQDTAKWHWTNRWLIDKQRERTETDKADQAAREEALRKHNAMTRWIASGALFVAT